jgi:hypothetical protein
MAYGTTTWSSIHIKGLKPIKQGSYAGLNLPLAVNERALHSFKGTYHNSEFNSSVDVYVNFTTMRLIIDDLTIWFRSISAFEGTVSSKGGGYIEVWNKGPALNGVSFDAPSDVEAIIKLLTEKTC